MSITLSVRLPDDLAEWLAGVSRRTGVAKGKILKDQLRLARSSGEKPFMRLAGSAAGPSGLSRRKGFSTR